MLDVGEHRTAYLIARDAALPSRDIYKTEQEFTAGWIALRFLNDPAVAAQHFARIGVGSVEPDRAGARRLLAGPRGGSRGPRAGGPRRLYAAPPSNRPAITANWRAPSSACRRSN